MCDCLGKVMLALEILNGLSQDYRCEPVTAIMCRGSSLICTTEWPWPTFWMLRLETKMDLNGFGLYLDTFLIEFFFNK